MATTFTRKAQTYNAETGVMTTTETTVAGAAIKGATGGLTAAGILALLGRLARKGKKAR